VHPCGKAGQGRRNETRQPDMGRLAPRPPPEVHARYSSRTTHPRGGAPDDPSRSAALEWGAPVGAPALRATHVGSAESARKYKALGAGSALFHRREGDESQNDSSASAREFLAATASAWVRRARVQHAPRRGVLGLTQRLIPCTLAPSRPNGRLAMSLFSTQGTVACRVPARRSSSAIPSKQLAPCETRTTLSDCLDTQYSASCRALSLLSHAYHPIRSVSIAALSSR
jgi:hypothetical protein